jgi:hypothetical protein
LQVRGGGQGRGRTADLPLFRRNNRPVRGTHTKVDGRGRVPVAVDGCRRCRHRCRQTRHGPEQVAPGRGSDADGTPWAPNRRGYGATQRDLVMLRRMTLNASASSRLADPPQRAWSCSKLAALLDIRLERRLGIGAVAVCRLARADRGRDAVRDADVMVAGELGRLGLLDGRPDLSRGWSGVGAVCAPGA